MKKFLSSVLLLLLCVSLCACGKTEAAKSCQRLIKNIGAVTLDSAQAIELAEKTYSALSDEEKEQISKSGTTLAEARASYNQLYIEEYLADIVAMIAQIGEVTLESETEISDAEKAVAKLSADEKAMLTTEIEILNAARASYKTAAAVDSAKKLDADIDNIGEVTLETKDVIKDIRSRYDLMSKEAKSYVKNISMFESAEDELSVLTEAEKQRILDEYLPKFNEFSDNFESITWYMHKNKPQYVNERCYIIPYIGIQENGQAVLGIEYNYTGKDWVFFKELEYKVNGEKQTKSVNYFSITRDTFYGGVYEWFRDASFPYTSSESNVPQFLKSISEDPDAKVRFSGDNGKSYTYTVTAADKQAMKDALTLYGALMNW